LRFVQSFGDLIDIARAQGAQALATGHYARRIESEEGAELHRARDDGRDQSYFLFALSRAQIDFARFPLGGYTKTEVRAMAAELQLPVAAKPDSQDICFVPGGDYASVVTQLNPRAAQAGEIVDRDGRVLGRHGGIIHFTVGQRRGLALGNRSGDANEPLFVIALDAEKRQVVVGPRTALTQSEVFLRDVNWLGEAVGSEGVAVTVKLRSTQPPVPARFFKDDTQGHIVLDQPLLGVSPGQAGVVYHETRVLGGGWIYSRK
jgi:tRNA-specific 2-thiouridylase